MALVCEICNEEIPGDSVTGECEGYFMIWINGVLTRVCHKCETEMRVANETKTSADNLA